MELLTNLRNVKSTSGVEERNIEHLKQIFEKAVGNKNEIHLDDFKRILKSKNALFTERVFKIFDTDDSGSISLEEFIQNVTKFAHNTADHKMKLLFEVYDQDGNGLIQFSELKEVMEACMEESGLKFSEEQINDLTSVLFEDTDTEKRGAITFEALKKQMERYPGLLENLSVSVEQWLLPEESHKKTSLRGILPDAWRHKMSYSYMKNNIVFLTFLVAIFIVNVGLFVSRAIQYRNTAEFPYAMLARAYGQCLNFNCAFVLALMLRQCITFLRARGFSSFLPLDHHIYFHKLTGILIFIYGIIHTVMHLCNFCLFAENSYRVINIGKDTYNYTIVDWIFTMKPGLFGTVPGIANPSGVALTIIIIIMYFCSQSFIRRGGCFEVFYWTHVLYIPFWILLLLHGPNFWKWFLLPGIIYILEWLIRIIRSRSELGKTSIITGHFLKPNVTYLEIKRPHQFHFNPGDYLFIRIPAIAKYEWHPFTISSAPEQKDYITLHVRGEGEWTNRLLNYIKEMEESTPTEVICDKDTCHDIVVQLDYKSEKPGLNNVIKKPVIKVNSVEIEDCSVSSICPQNIQKEKNLFKFHIAMRAPFNKSLSMPDIVCPHDSMKGKYILCEKLDAQNTDVEEVKVFPDNNHPSKTDFTYSEDASPHDKLLTSSDKISLASKKDDHGILQVYINGPYGAPSSHIFRAEHAVLIATGIGVTPFASILQSIMHRYLEARHTCPKCKHSFSAEIPATVMNLKKVDFFWINRDQQSFEWFVSLLSQLEIQQAELVETMDRFLDMHMYITSALNHTDMKAVGLQIALDLLHKKEKRDLITGLRTRTKNGRPNWEEVFSKLKQEKKGKITVFYCGPPNLGKILRQMCDKNEISFRSEVF